MSEYIKSHSNYVIKKKHQDVNDGTIYERDITTIGGVDSFNANETPYYQSGNFIITVNDSAPYSKQISTAKWETNDNGKEVWTIDDLKEAEETSNSTYSNAIKQDYYKLTTFAYYGSCSELLRGSINNITVNFPSELYAPIINDDEGLIAIYNDTNDRQVTDDGDVVGTVSMPLPKRLGGDNLYILDNPFGLDIYSQEYSQEIVESSLKYFAYDNYKKYEIIDKNGVKSDITQWKISLYPFPCDGSRKIATVSVVGDNNAFTIQVYNGNNDSVVYLVDKSVLGIHIRPKEKYINEYFNGLTRFENVLLNRDTKPLYKASFEILSESDYGYSSQLKDFIFPTTFGGYNLDVSTEAFHVYLNELTNIGSFYDEYFCDNMWRSMTHEAIKNFDWTYERKFYDGEEEPYIEGGTKLQKFIRLMGREFDEIKQYIEALSNSHKVSYDELNNVANYFLTDLLTTEGWDLNNIYPLITKYESTLKQLTSVTEDVTSVIKPYNSKTTPYWVQYGSCDETQNVYFCREKCKNEPKVSIYLPSVTYSTALTTGNNDYVVDTNANCLREVIKSYSSDREYTMKEVNDHFMRMLKLNSRSLLSRKGTIDGVETMLALFGYESITHFTDLGGTEDEKKTKSLFDINEKTVLAHGLLDTYDAEKQDFTLSWVNSTKYTSREGDWAYEGLPVARLRKSETENWIFPYFNKDTQYDNEICYQSRGGWRMSHPIMFTKQDFILKEDKNSWTYFFTETLTKIYHVGNLEELLAIDVDNLENGDFYYVNDLSKDYMVVDGILYDIYSENYNGEEQYFIFTTVQDNAVVVGQTVFEGDINVSYPYDKNMNYRHLISEYDDGTDIKIYIIDGKIEAYNTYLSINNYCLFHNGSMLGENDNLTHYFKLTDKTFKHELSLEGWSQILTTDDDYRYIDLFAEKYKGNNPHASHPSYDNGSEYLVNYASLFKYNIDDGNINPNCYKDYETYTEYISDLKNIGFRFSSSPQLSELICNGNYSQSVFDDCKIHYFGDLTKLNEECNPKNWQRYCYERYDKEFIGNSVLNLSRNNMKSYSAFTYGDDSEYKVANDSASLKTYLEEKVKELAWNGMPEQVINTKVFELTFYVHYNKGTDKYYNEVKYIDSVILPYVEQMIPSTAIFKVYYK